MSAQRSHARCSGGATMTCPIPPIAQKGCGADLMPGLPLTSLSMNVLPVI